MGSGVRDLNSLILLSGGARAGSGIVHSILPFMGVSLSTEHPGPFILLMKQGQRIKEKCIITLDPKPYMYALAGNVVCEHGVHLLIFAGGTVQYVEVPPSPDAPFIRDFPWS